MKKLIHIVGNRPQFVKLAVLYNHIEKHSDIVQEIIHTGHHYDYSMSDIFFEELAIPKPTHNFNIQATQNLFIGEATEKLEQYFASQKDSVVLVYGDTNTTMAAAIAAKRTNTKLIHFEAGVRTYENSMPEEINRIITDRLADVNYCCTQHNMNTMFAEGYYVSIPSNVILTGDLMLDAFNKIEPALQNVTSEKEYIACTVHRAANLSSKQNLTNIINALNEINKSIPVLMPVHPHTQRKIDEYEIVPTFTLLPALGYPNMKRLLLDAAYVITDSGGTSREAYFSKKKSLILMDTPFWSEILAENCSVNSIISDNNILADFEKMKSLHSNFETAIFGHGNAAENILTHLKAYL